MVSRGDTAPDFTAPVANGSVEPRTLSELLPEEAPIVLAFFPGAFTSTCSHEMKTFQDRLDEITDAGGTLYGVSVDTPFALNEFRDELSLSFDLISDSTRELVEKYGVTTDVADMGVEDLAQRAIVVVDDTQTVTYAWVADNAGLEPEYDVVQQAIEDAA